MAVPLIFQPLVKYAQFEGRSRRSEFWLWVLFRLVVSCVLAGIVLACLGPIFAQIAAHPHADEAQSQSLAIGMMGNMFRVYGLFMLVELALLLPTLTVSVRRLHDVNRSGLWLLMPVGVAFGGMIVVAIIGAVTAAAMIAAHPDPHVVGGEGIGYAFGIFLVYAIYLLAVLIADIVMLVFFVTEGTKGPNRFGPDPKALVPPGGAQLADPTKLA